MITAVRYGELTGDNTQVASAVDAAITEAMAMLEEYLDRPLAEAERTEHLHPDRRGRLWPRATPIIDAGPYEVDGLGLFGLWPVPDFLSATTSIEVTYTGGWADQRAGDYDPAASNQLPFCIQRDLANAAYRLLRPQPPETTTPHNATEVHLGDAGLSYGTGGAGAVTAAGTDPWWSRRTRSYRYQPAFTGPDIGACV